MRIFVWEYIGPVSSSWHNSGGVLVIAESIDRAKTLVDELRLSNGITPKDLASDPLGEPELQAELVGDHEERIMVFPDAGCC